MKANNWAIRRINLFNEHVKQKKVPTRLDHFLNYYLEQDGDLNRIFLNINVFVLKMNCVKRHFYDKNDRQQYQ